MERGKLMRSHKMKAHSILLILFLIIGLVMVGCGGDEDITKQPDGGNGTEEQTDSNSREDAEDEAEPAEVDYPDEVTYWALLDPNTAVAAKDLNDMTAYKKIEEITGTRVEWIHPPGDRHEQFNLMMSNRSDLPDIIEYGWLSVPRGPDEAIADGTILRLNELIDDHAPNFKKYLDENPEIAKMIMTDEGNIYAFPFLIEDDDMLLVVKGPMLRQDWLDTLGLGRPTTIDEWETVLTAFRDEDPNGNGEADEIPLLLELGDMKYNGAFSSAWGNIPWFYNDNGTVKFGGIEPEFKEFLTTMSDWYNKGLLDPDFNITDHDLKNAKMTGEQLGALYAFAGSGIGFYAGLMAEENPDFNLVAAGHPSLEPGGKAALGFKNHPFRGEPMAAITAGVENPEEIVKWLDFGYSEEGHMLFNFGFEGETYEMIDGYPTYTDEILNNPDGLPVTQAMGIHFRAGYNGIMVQDKRYIEQYYELDAQKEAGGIWGDSADFDIKMPPITMTADENQEYANIMGDLETYFDEMFVRFIMNAEPLDNFDQFVETLHSMGIERAIDLQQDALDRYNAR